MWRVGQIALLLAVSFGLSSPQNIPQDLVVKTAKGKVRGFSTTSGKTHIKKSFFFSGRTTKVLPSLH